VVVPVCQVTNEGRTRTYRFVGGAEIVRAADAKLVQFSVIKMLISG